MTSNKTRALTIFQAWREWNKDRSLQFCIQRFKQIDVLRQASYAELLGAILFQCCTFNSAQENERAERIIAVLKNSKSAYILKNYVRAYAFEAYSVKGQRFLKLLQQYGIDPRRI